MSRTKTEDMFALSPSHNFYYYIEPTDMRMSFNGLSGKVMDHYENTNQTNAVYLFVNKRRDKMKILHWTQEGLMIYYKRLERGFYELPKYELTQSMVCLTYTKMIMIIDGISIVKLSENKRYKSKK